MTENIKVITDWVSLEFYFKIKLVPHSKHTAFGLWKHFSRKRIAVCSEILKKRKTTGWTESIYLLC